MAIAYTPTADEPANNGLPWQVRSISNSLTRFLTGLSAIEIAHSRRESLEGRFEVHGRQMTAAQGSEGR